MNWPVVEVILKTNRGEHITRVTANFWLTTAAVS